ncbi:MAG: EAL domain-containing protein [Magnetococcales bacterium]|nr:EAL domain-containing protein [Magnetococcales bacterium]NGZ25492.1 EAL domain-containing protein [Magnetococcales bacterium]
MSQVEKILIVDDEFINQQIAIAVMAKNHYNYMVVSTGEEALEAVARWKPDLILLDLLLPGMDGFEVVRRLKQQESSRAIPVVLVTSMSDRQSRLEGLRAGAEDFINKPIDADELSARMSNLLRLKRMHDFLEANNRVLSNYDALTGLPNRTLFRDRLVHDLISARNHSEELAVLLVEITDLKRINDSLGVMAGDQILTMVGQRLSESLTTVDMVARLSGGEFGVLQKRPMVDEEMRLVAASLLAHFSRPFKLANHEIFVAANIGGSCAPKDGEEIEELLRRAGVALTFAKRSRRNGFEFYFPAMDDKDRGRLTLEAHLHHALEKNELKVYYQPKIDTLTRRMVGMEALLRWFSPEMGMISPARFIPLAEETDLIVPIGDWVLHTACMETQRLRREGLELNVAVNLSARQLLHGGVCHSVSRSLAESGLPPHALELEITESCVLENVDKTIALIQEIRAMGVTCALDDFGTGYSSLNYLKRLPINTLKLDRSFLSQIPHEANDTAIVRAVISLAHSLHLHVVAEGVENLEQIAFLAQQRCDQLQGFYFSKPVPLDEFIPLAHKYARQSWHNP